MKVNKEEYFQRVLKLATLSKINFENKSLADLYKLIAEVELPLMFSNSDEAFFEGFFYKKNTSVPDPFENCKRRVIYIDNPHFDEDYKKEAENSFADYNGDRVNLLRDVSYFNTSFSYPNYPYSEKLDLTEYGSKLNDYFLYGDKTIQSSCCSFKESIKNKWSTNFSFAKQYLEKVESSDYQQTSKVLNLG